MVREKSGQEATGERIPTDRASIREWAEKLKVDELELRNIMQAEGTHVAAVVGELKRRREGRRS